MEPFWPHLPISIPASEGVPLWFDIIGWVFQIVIMVTVIWLVTRWAVRMEREFGERRAANSASGKQDPSVRS